ncbi:hypothetical protein EVAR_24756_1 [Eumeta japonica]|uniref:Uncharacterized protein n=1 Tax=Eumeta variegata TaxID=151549 RepID=A0A4C1VDP8_EUMVA|nr:hypothetical protein EVAR_24756_1 [Eumeta japonica]
MLCARRSLARTVYLRGRSIARGAVGEPRSSAARPAAVGSAPVPRRDRSTPGQLAETIPDTRKRRVDAGGRAGRSRDGRSSARSALCGAIFAFVRRGRQLTLRRWSAVTSYVLSQPERRDQYVTGLLGKNRISDEGGKWDNRFAILWTNGNSRNCFFMHWPIFRRSSADLSTNRFAGNWVESATRWLATGAGGVAAVCLRAPVAAAGRRANIYTLIIM